MTPHAVVMRMSMLKRRCVLTSRQSPGRGSPPKPTIIRTFSPLHTDSMARTSSAEPQPLPDGTPRHTLESNQLIHARYERVLTDQRNSVLVNKRTVCMRTQHPSKHGARGSTLHACATQHASATLHAYAHIPLHACAHIDPYACAHIDLHARAHIDLRECAHIDLHACAQIGWQDTLPLTVWLMVHSPASHTRRLCYVSTRVVVVLNPSFSTYYVQYAYAYTHTDAAEDADLNICICMRGQ